MKDPFQYIFRFCCDPGFNDEAEISALERYVEQARIDDVAVFANVEEINTGHMTYGEQDVYLALMRRVSAMLAEKGVTMSVNQWHSVMHADLGKTANPSQGFRRMVDIRGNEAELCVCPLCETWQEYIAGLYARYAQLEPSVLWVEDDFRLHNHEPLIWGGCFCEEHMKRYSRRAGRELTRQEFLKGVLQPGEPHPYRKIWLDVSRETMLSAARAIGNAVRGVSRQAKVGLMSSAPQIHAAEGRDWHALLHTLAAGQAPVDRIHLPGYQENSPSAYLQGFNMVSMLTRAMLPPETEVYPELENYPFSLFSKSRRFTRFQLLSALPLSLSGITLDLYDLNGNGIVWEDGYQETLRGAKDFLNEMTQSGVFRGERKGVQVLFSPDSAYTLHTDQGLSMEELYPQEAFFAGLLPAMGVPYVYSGDMGARGRVVAASGQVLRNWGKDELEQLFRNNFVILSGDAVWTLCGMGLGYLAGVESARWMRQNQGEYAFEQVTNGKIYRGRENARASAIISCSDVLDIRYLAGENAEEYTAFYDSYRKRAAAGETVVNGRVLIYPFGHFESATAIPPMLLNSLRQEILHDVLRAANAPFPLVKGAPYLEPYCFETGDTTALYLVNGSTDPAESITVVNAGERGLTAVCSETGKAEQAGAGTQAGLKIGPPLGSMESMLLTWLRTDKS